MRSLVEDAADLVAAAVGGAWTVYPHAVPKAPTYPYVWVYGNTGVADSDDFTNTPALRDVTLWVTSTASRPDPMQAADQAAWGAEKAQAALLPWRPYGWRPQQLTSQPPNRDDDLPDATIFFAVDTYGITAQP